MVTSGASCMIGVPGGRVRAAKTPGPLLRLGLIIDFRRAE